MTVQELYDQVLRLGFETSIEDDDIFFHAVNRAILQVCKIRPAVRSYQIHHRPLKNLIGLDTIAPMDKEEDVLFDIDGAKSYYFETNGTGVVYFEDGNGTVLDSMELSSVGFQAYKGFVKEGVKRICFTGEYLYSIKNVAAYAYKLSDRPEDIPAYGAYAKYDISTLVTDFMELCCPPIKEGVPNEILNQGYEVEGNTILLPREAKGVFKVLYHHRPAYVTALHMDDDIDLDEELCSLLPTLVAAYVWVEDEPEKAEYYLNLWRERVAEIETKERVIAPVAYKSVNGW